MMDSIDKSVETLQAIFPDWDEKDLKRVLCHFAGDRGSAIDAILAHGDSKPEDLCPSESEDDFYDKVNENENEEELESRKSHSYHSAFDSPKSAASADNVTDVPILTDEKNDDFGGTASIAVSNKDNEMMVQDVINRNDDSDQDPASGERSIVGTLVSSSGVNLDGIITVKSIENRNDSDSVDNEIGMDANDLEDRGTLHEQCCSGEKKKYWRDGTITIIIVAFSLLAASLKRINSMQYGLEYDVWAKTLDAGVQQAGLYLGPIGYRFIKFPSIQIQTKVEDTCISRDGLRIRFGASYQYRLKKEMILDAVLSYRNYETWKDVTDSAANSGIQAACSDWNVTDFQNKWDSVQDSMYEEVRKKLEGGVLNNSQDHYHDGMYAKAVALQLTKIMLPPQYIQAVREKQAAKEDVNLALQQRTQETIREKTRLLVAERKAEIMMDRAYNIANVTLTQAGYTADQTKFMFDQESSVLSQAQSFLSLDANGVLSFMSNKLYEKVPELRTRMTEPVGASSLRL